MQTGAFGNFVARKVYLILALKLFAKALANQIFIFSKKSELIIFNTSRDAIAINYFESLFALQTLIFTTF